MKTVQGDLIELAKAGAFDVIIQGCNCQCRMGRGIALTIKQQFPEAYTADCQTEIGDRAKLGNFTTVQIDRDGFDTPPAEARRILGSTIQLAPAGSHQLE
jgi:O-acetyl-ADP-ribose deacetylase (regulator of RNase III)